MDKRLRAGFCNVVLACSLLAQPNGVEAVWDMLAKGERGQAVQALQRIISSNPRDAEARLVLGSILAEEGNRAEALKHLEEGVRLQPESAEAHQALGEALKTFGEPAGARREFQKAVTLNPEFGQAQADLGLALLEAGESAPAADHLEQAIRIFGNHADSAYPRYLRAKIHSERGETGKAAASLAIAVSLRPDFAEAWSDLGQAKKALGDEGGALAAFQQSVKADPANAVAQYRLGAEYLRQRQPALALQHLRQAYRLDPKNQSTLNSLMLALRQNGLPEEAARVKAELAEVLREIDRESRAAFTALRLNNEGAALEQAGNLQGALEKYKAARELDPHHIGIRLNYAVVLLRLGQWEQGLSELREAERRDPDNPNVKATLTDALKQAPPGVAKKTRQ